MMNILKILPVLIICLSFTLSTEAREKLETVNDSRVVTSKKMQEPMIIMPRSQFEAALKEAEKDPCGEEDIYYGRDKPTGPDSTVNPSKCCGCVEVTFTPEQTGGEAQTSKVCQCNCPNGQTDDGCEDNCS